MDVVHPVRIGLRETVRHKLDAPVFNAFHGGLHEGFHFDKPLRGNKGFHDVVAALAVTDSMGRVFDLDEKTQVLQVLDDMLAAFVTVFPFVFAGVRRHLAVKTDDRQTGQLLALPHFIVVGIMGRRNLYGARTKFKVNVFVGHNGDKAVHDGKANLFPTRSL